MADPDEFHEETREQDTPPFLDTGPRSYDPLENALKEGDLYGRGITGSYRKTPMTRAGFFMLGVMLIGGSVVGVAMCQERVSRVLMTFVGLGWVLCGGLLIRAAVSPQRK